MVADTVTIRLHLMENSECMWIVIFRAAAEEHIVVHVFYDTFVTVERMKLPFLVTFFSQFVKHYSNYYENNNDWNYNGESYCQYALYWINTEFIFSRL